MPFLRVLPDSLFFFLNSGRFQKIFNNSERFNRLDLPYKSIQSPAIIDGQFFDHPDTGFFIRYVHKRFAVLCVFFFMNNLGIDDRSCSQACFVLNVCLSGVKNIRQCQLVARAVKLLTRPGVFCYQTVQENRLHPV
ncbi:hypothetical protein HNR65_003472 [Desulfosalsimonas propionicica]|uniref:Uncharacterized protein n=1 Tax=Desulfosalsimonas propionicica TaxID=332175 RepID=A0A7W0HM84_9BACT|nr:hypothetical protein [Desulfosalsimonas propionicica]MBA2883115.1 hypothetical protein [Desulfosalsimonas propionicica]